MKTKTIRKQQLVMQWLLSSTSLNRIFITILHENAQITLYVKVTTICYPIIGDLKYYLAENHELWSLENQTYQNMIYFVLRDSGK